MKASFATYLLLFDSIWSMIRLKSSLIEMSVYLSRSLIKLWYVGIEYCHVLSVAMFCLIKSLFRFVNSDQILSHIEILFNLASLAICLMKDHCDVSIEAANQITLSLEQSQRLTYGSLQNLYIVIWPSPLTATILRLQLLQTRPRGMDKIPSLRNFFGKYSLASRMGDPLLAAKGSSAANF